MRRISSGLYSTIYAKVTDTERTAIKTCSTDGYSVGIPESYIREVEVMKNCNHPNVMSVRSLTIDHLTREYTIAMPLGLFDLSDTSCMRYNEKDVLCGIVRGLYYLESKGILHGDLKPENIILFPDNNGKPLQNVKITNGRYCPVITDFGLSYQELNSNVVQCEMTTEDWKSPEEMLSKYKRVHRGFATITWTFGCLMYYVLTGMKLIAENNFTDAFRRMEDVAGVPNDSQVYRSLATVLGMSAKEARVRTSKLLDGVEDDLFSKCLQWNASDRLTMTEICNHTYFDMRVEKIDTRGILVDNEYSSSANKSYTRFLEYLRDIVTDEMKEVVPLAVEIFKRAELEASRITTIACVSLASKVKYMYIDVSGLTCHDKLAKEEERIMEACDYKLLTTTTLSYLGENVTGREYRIKRDKLVRRLLKNKA